MKVVQETERLLLRPFEVSDAEALMQMEQEPDFLRYVGRKPFVDVESKSTHLFCRSTAIPSVTVLGRSSRNGRATLSEHAA